MKEKKGWCRCKLRSSDVFGFDGKYKIDLGGLACIKKRADLGGDRGGNRGVPAGRF